MSINGISSAGPPVYSATEGTGRRLEIIPGTPSSEADSSSRVSLSGKAPLGDDGGQSSNGFALSGVAAYRSVANSS